MEEKNSSIQKKKTVSVLLFSKNSTRTDLALNPSLRSESQHTGFVYYSRITILISVPAVN